MRILAQATASLLPHWAPLLPPALARSRTDVLCGAAPLAANEALWLAPRMRNSKSAPHVASSTFQEVEPVRIGRECQLEGVVGVIPIAVPINQSPKCPHDLKALLASKKGVRQVEQHMAVDDFRRTTRQARGHPIFWAGTDCIAVVSCC
jgi:hypothetical protein